MRSPEDSELARLYDRLILSRPRVVAVVVLAVVGLCLAGLPRFRMDASSDSIVLEGDADLRYYDDSRITFGDDASLFVALEPSSDLFSRSTLDAVRELTSELGAVSGVRSVTSLLSVPLFLSPPTGLVGLASGYGTLSDPEVDLELARTEVLQNPLYVGSVISEGGSATAIQLQLESDPRIGQLEARRYELRDAQGSGELSSDGSAELRAVEREYRELLTLNGDARRKQIRDVREVIAGFAERHPDLGRIELGGVPMIVTDIVRYIERDVVVFGGAVVVFVIVVLWLLFRSWQWVVLPTVTCLATTLSMVGLLGWMDWRTTIVTSNLTSLLFILTMAMAIHIVVRFREVQAGPESADTQCLVRVAVARVARPCLYTVLTTMVGFGSLYVSQIRPVMDFALMMGLGLAIAFVLCFTLLPALVLVTPPAVSPSRDLADLDRPTWLSEIGAFSTRRNAPIVLATLALVAVSLFGVMRLQVENRFIDYFKSDTPIHRGMTFIDQVLGGTTPLEITLEGGEEDAWLDDARLLELRALHDWLAEQPEIGQVASLATLVRILEQVIENDPNPVLRGVKVNRFLLSAVRSRVPEDVARTALQPYVSADYARSRIVARVRESSSELRRKELLERIDSHLGQRAELEALAPRVTGMFVLYNNMLQSLFRSQVQTIGAVFLAVWAMFALLFRSLRTATIAVIPNVVPVLVVLGAQGLTGVPLDMMTIMVAGVTLGIAVDDTTHYLYRYRHEIQSGASATDATVRSLNSVGRAMLSTTVAITAGFSILALSSFWPTIYFGLFVGLAMIVALVADATLLPILLARLRPFRRPESQRLSSS